MHELSIAMSIIEIAEENAKNANTSVISEIELEIGTQAGVVMDALTFAIEAAKKGTMLEGAKWVINEVPAIARCADCKHEFPTPDLFSPCPKCGNPFSDVFQGRELRVKSLKAE
ncbi:MAG: hydrogenase maturation nickel metallochaperone HypA [Bacteroidales bacterium]|nr:hydrogenase maturation nickel metallochaperone HypA [Bacteroidales bacterium]MCF8402747.1 hydrogenase maturation nickel metallochaperone HypA [Bacteroidales bacterium]